MWNNNKNVQLKKKKYFSNKTVSSFPQLLVKACLFWKEFLKEVYHFRGIRNKGKGRDDSPGLCDTADYFICSAIDPLNRVSENPRI